MLTNTVSTRMTEADLHQVSVLISRKLGLHFPLNRYTELERGVFQIAIECGYKDLSSFLKRICSPDLPASEIEIYAKHLTIGETYFYRERQRFSTLESDILPRLIRARRKTNKTIRIWSAGCSSGEEPYTIAILLKKLIPDIKDWNISILASDINPVALQRAENGIYGNWSFRLTPEKFKEKYFEQLPDEKYKLNDDIKKMVSFTFLNLADDVYPTLFTRTNAIDILFCRNVLMYFGEATIEPILKKFLHCLNEDGLLIASLVESHLITDPGFVPEKIGESIFFRKTTKHNLINVAQSEETEYPVFSFIKNDKSEEQQTIAALSAEVAVLPEQLQVESIECLPDSDLSTEERLHTARLCFEQADYERTVKLLTATDPEISSDPAIMILLARTYANLGQLDIAAQWGRKAASLDKTNKDIHFYTGSILYENGNIDEAISSFEKVLYLDPKYVLVYFYLATFSRQKQNQDESMRYLKYASRLLNDHQEDDILEGSEGITAGRLREIILSLING